MIDLGVQVAITSYYRNLSNIAHNVPEGEFVKVIPVEWSRFP